MKFTGNGHVELRPPEDLEDLKAYTSLALSLQRPEGRGDGRRRRRQTRLSGDMFVLYLGNRDVSVSARASLSAPRDLVLDLSNLFPFLALEGLYRHGPEEQRAAHRLQAERFGVRDQNGLHHHVGIRAGQV